MLAIFRNPPSSLFITFLSLSLLGAGQFAVAQSGTTGSGTTPNPVVSQGSSTTAPAGSQAGSTTAGSTSSGSAARMPAQPPIAMEGFCPVCIIEMRKWVKGSPKYAVNLDGKQYHFPGEEQRQVFLKSVAKYTPALSGDCVVCFAEGGARTPGSVYFSAIHKDRLYLFPSQNEKDKFMANPAKYENVDLAAGGMCTVCRVEMQQQVPGKPEFSMVFRGKRYYFPGQEQRKMFLANPTKYEDR